MSYCSNCGSILSRNANFCHVCGTKVEVQDLFEETKPQENFQPQQTIVEEKPYRSYYDEYRSLDKGEEIPETLVKSKKPFVPGLVAFIGSLVLGGEAGIQYMIGMLTYNTSYNKGLVSYKDYITSVNGLLSSTAFFLFLCSIIGLTLGITGIRVAKKGNSKKGLIFSILAIVIATVALGLGILCFVVRSMLK